MNELSLQDLKNEVDRIEVRRCPCGKGLLSDACAVVYRSTERVKKMLVCCRQCGPRVADIMKGQLFIVTAKEKAMAVYIQVKFQCDAIGCQSIAVDKWVNVENSRPNEELPSGWDSVPRGEDDEYGPPRIRCSVCKKKNAPMPTRVRSTT